MCKISTVIVTLFTSLVVDILAVNSPQMTFFTPPSHETTIHLESKYGYSATLILTREKLLAHMKNVNSDNGGGNQTKTKEGKVSEFVILGPDYLFHGVSAVIQEMNLRTKENGCKDFVQFAANAEGVDKSNKICGRISRDENWNGKNVTDPRLQRSYFNADGTIHLYFSSDYLEEVGGDKSNDSDVIDSTLESDIGIEIVFTSYTVCPNPANSWKKLKSCSKRENMSCIYSTLFCDSKIDCGFQDEFGVDEDGCYIPYIYISACIIGSLFLTGSLIYMFLRWVTEVPKQYQSSMTT